MWNWLEAAGRLGGVVPSLVGVGQYYTELVKAAERAYGDTPLLPFTGAWTRDEMWTRTHRRPLVFGPGGSAERRPQGLLRAGLLAPKGLPTLHGGKSGWVLEAEYRRNANLSLSLAPTSTRGLGCTEQVRVSK